jgi:hypothetical protein
MIEGLSTAQASAGRIRPPSVPARNMPPTRTPRRDAFAPTVALPSTPLQPFPHSAATRFHVDLRTMSDANTSHNGAARTCDHPVGQVTGRNLGLVVVTDE